MRQIGGPGVERASGMAGGLRHCVQLLQSFRLILLMHFNQLRDWILRHDVAWLTRTLLRTETDITTWHRCCVVGRCRRCRFFGLLRRAAKQCDANSQSSQSSRIQSKYQHYLNLEPAFSIATASRTWGRAVLFFASWVPNKHPLNPNRSWS